MEATRHTTTSVYLSDWQKEPIQASLSRKRGNGGIFSLFQDLQEGQKIRLTGLPIKSDAKLHHQTPTVEMLLLWPLGSGNSAHMPDAGHKISQDRPQPSLTIMYLSLSILARRNSAQHLLYGVCIRTDILHSVAGA